MWGAWVDNNGEYGYDNRPLAPLQEYHFDRWWFVSIDYSIVSRPSQTLTTYPRDQHNHFEHPPPNNTFFELPAGGVAKGQVACNIRYTDMWDVSKGPRDYADGLACDIDYVKKSTNALHVSIFHTLIDATIADLPSLCATGYVVAISPIFRPD